MTSPRSTQFFFHEGPCMKMDELKMLLGPGVYTLWKDNQALYIGSAQNMMHRVGHPKHEQLRLAMAEATKIEFETFGEWEKNPRRRLEMIRDHEAQKIIDFQPKYNRTGKLGTTNRFSS